MTINVIINGAQGKMGSTTQKALVSQKDLKLVATMGRNDDLAKTIKETKADVVIDFTTPQVVFTNAQTILQAGARPVIGTTGLTTDQITTLKQTCQSLKRGAVIAPNFSLSAVLMMKYAKDAVKYFPDVEIIEMHHPQKVDAPSGTAIKTAQMMTEAQTPHNQKASQTNHARGDTSHGITIHSIRLPGLFSHQSVIFGGNGETLTITHDGLDRQAMMPGVFLACRKVVKLDHLIYGLENLL